VRFSRQLDPEMMKGNDERHDGKSQKIMML
jgi:hypothetical protein